VEHAEAGLAMLDLERERLLGRKIGLSPCVGILAYINIAFWMLAFPERSKHAGERGLALALEIGHPPSIGFALTAKTGSSYLQGDAKSTLASADEALRLAREERLGFWEPMINVFRGWAVAELGARTEGTALIRDAIKRYREAGNGIQQIWFYAILAETQWKSGDRSDAFATLATARPLARENGEALFEPELYRLEGEFLLAEAMEASTADCQSRLADAERHILEALDLARCQDATMLELRSLVSLCSVRRKQGDVAPARDELRKVYQSFTEGFEAPDLREARAMLEATSE
jgi:hypothetical protein